MKIIVESGATKTDWCAISASGEIRQIRSEGMNFSTKVGASTIESQIQKAIMALNTDNEPVSEVHLYAAGLVAPRTSGSVEYASDLLGAARAVCGQAPGIAANLGTGSNSCLYDGAQIVRNVHSCGFILGDEGSAASLGKMFMADFLKGLVPEALSKEFASSFEVDYATVVTNVYKGDTPGRYLGSFAPWIIERSTKDEYLHELVRTNFRLFIERALKRYDVASYPVGIVGGFGYALRDVFTEVASAYGIRISSIVATPMEGLIRYHND